MHFSTFMIQEKGENSSETNTGANVGHYNIIIILAFYCYCINLRYHSCTYVICSCYSMVYIPQQHKSILLVTRTYYSPHIIYVQLAFMHMLLHFQFQCAYVYPSGIRCPNEAHAGCIYCYLHCKGDC